MANASSAIFYEAKIRLESYSFLSIYTRKTRRSSLSRYGIQLVELNRGDFKVQPQSHKELLIVSELLIFSGYA